MKKWSSALLCFLLVAVLLTVYMLRLSEWQFFQGGKFDKLSAGSTSFFVKLDGARGEILDTNGTALAGSRTIYNVVMNAITMDTDRNPAIVKALRLIKENNVKWEDKLPIELDERGAYRFVEDKESEIKFLKSEDMLSMQEYATADECMTALSQRYDTEDYSRKEGRDLISVRYAMTKAQFSRSAPHVIAEDVSMEFIQKLSEYSGEMPGIEVRVATARDYGDGDTAPHIIGTLSAITQEQYDAYAQKGESYSADNVSGYTYTDTIGMSGIESVFESVLRGKNGKEQISLDSEGGVEKTDITELPSAGSNVFLTLDKELQLVLNDSLARNVQASKKKDCIAGGAVVLDIDSFGVLAASSYPSYDLGMYMEDDKYYYDLMKDETKPLFNRAFDGVFTPGSVMKPAVGIAGLEEGVIDENSSVFCDGAYRFYESDPLACLGVHDYASINKALYRSCNTFFCEVGRKLGIERIGVYANLFSLGEKTGVEIGEASGIMSNPEEYQENHGVPWIDGVTIQAAIGQADSMFSPLQLATYCATIANDGVRLKTHLLDKVMDFDNKLVMEEYEPQVVESMELNPKNLGIIKQGMRDVCSEAGTASSFADYGIAVAAKTGTAENPGHSDNTVFMAYAPYDKPEIAVAVVLEYGSDGQLSQAVARDVFDCYFYGKTMDVKAKEAQAAKKKAAEEE